MDGGIPKDARAQTLRFKYNDLESVRALFAAHPGKIAAVFLEASRIEEPAPGFLEGLKATCAAEGAVLVFDEMITGFRWGLPGAQSVYRVTADLATFGKALANGFALSAVCGRREIMRLGSREREGDNVFLLSTTHGAESSSLVAAIATMNVYQTEPVVAHLYRVGERLARGFRQAVERHALADYVDLKGRPCNLLFGTKDREGKASQSFRTLFLQETIRRGILMPSLVVSYSHKDEDIDRTVDAIDGALEVYARALQDGVERYLVGPPSRTVFDRW
jgi:glutamate-1-semialdehyde 2,1-aminomutase